MIILITLFELLATHLNHLGGPPLHALDSLLHHVLWNFVEFLLDFLFQSRN